MKTNLSTILLFILLSIGATSCSPSSTPAPILADAAFSCQVFLDVNGNDQVDSEDTPVEGARFYVEFNGVKAFIDTTDENGSAYILVPGGVEYPATIGILAPEGSDLIVVGFETVTITAETVPAATFLFTSK